MLLATYGVAGERTLDPLPWLNPSDIPWIRPDHTGRLAESWTIPVPSAGRRGATAYLPRRNAVEVSGIA